MSYARKAVGSVNSIAHGPAGTCGQLIIAWFYSVINLCRHHWAEPCTTGVLPTAEGKNIGVAMVIGLLAMSIMTTNRSRRNSITAATNTNTSYE